MYVSPVGTYPTFPVSPVYGGRQASAVATGVHAADSTPVSGDTVDFSAVPPAGYRVTKEPAPRPKLASVSPDYVVTAYRSQSNFYA